MTLDLFESFFDFVGDGKLTVGDDLLLLWMMNNKDDAEPVPITPKKKRLERTITDLRAKNLALAECSFFNISKNVQTIFERNGVTEKTGSQAVAELTAAFAYLSIAVSKASFSDKAACFDRMMACCRFDGSPVPAGSDLFAENREGVRQHETALVHENLTLILKSINDGTEAAEEFFVAFSRFMRSVEAIAADDPKSFCFEKTPGQLFFDCALTYLKKAQTETTAQAAGLLKTRILKRICKQKRRIFFTSALLSTVTFLALSGIPCLLIWAFLSTTQEEEDLTAAAMAFLLFVGIPFVFVVFLARACFRDLPKECREYADVRQAIKQEIGAQGSGSRAL